MSFEIIIIDSRVLQLRDLFCFDYDQFIALTKYRIDKQEYLRKYINNKKIKTKILYNPMEIEIAGLSFFVNKKLTKFIYDTSYDPIKIIKYLNNYDL